MEVRELPNTVSFKCLSDPTLVQDEGIISTNWPLLTLQDAKWYTAHGNPQYPKEASALYKN